MKKATIKSLLEPILISLKDFLLSLVLLILMLGNQFQKNKENNLPQNNAGIKSLLDATDIEIPDEER